MPQTPAMSQAWIYLLKLKKKKFQYADKLIPWKDVFPQSWEVHLPDPQQPLPLSRQGVTFRLQREPSFQRRQGPAGRDKKGGQTQPLPRKKAHLRLLVGESYPS